MPPISRGFSGRPASPPRRAACRPGSTSSRTSRCSPPARRRARRSTSGASRSTAPSTSRRRWTWDELLALPPETFTVDIHCVTKWTKLGTTWTGVSLDTLLEDVATEAEYLTAWCDGGYTTNLALEDVTDGRAWIAHTFDGEPLEPEHGGPARLLVPHLYFWKSAKWIRGLTFTRRGRARLLGGRRLPQPRRPMAGAAVLGRLSPPPGASATVREVVEETAAGAHARARRARLAGPRAPASTSTCGSPPRTATRRSARTRSPRRRRTRACELTVERIDDGEVSPYLAGVLQRGRRVRAARADRRALHVARRGRRPAAARRRRLRPRAADGDAAPPRGQRQRRGRAPARVLAQRRGDLLYARRARARSPARPASTSTRRSRASTPDGWTGFARPRSTPRCSTRVGPPPPRRRACSCAGRPPFVESAARPARRRSATTPAGHPRRALRTDWRK